jgi:hypothetical protein
LFVSLAVSSAYIGARDAVQLRYHLDQSVEYANESFITHATSLCRGLEESYRTLGETNTKAIFSTEGDYSRALSFVKSIGDEFGVEFPNLSHSRFWPKEEGGGEETAPMDVSQG